MRLASSSVVRFTGIGVVLFFAVCLYLSLTAGSGLPGQSVRTANAAFTDIDGLRVGDDVRIASVRVGRVQKIQYVDGRARVEMAIEPDQHVYRDASARVAARSALGQNFVMLDPGTSKSGEIADGGSLSNARVSTPVELDQVLSTFTPSTRAATKDLLRQTGQGLAGHSQDLSDFLKSAPHLLNDLGPVSDNLASEPTHLRDLISSSAHLAGRFKGRSAEIGQLIDSLGTTLQAVGVDDGQPVDGTLQAAPPALDNLTTAMTDLHGPLVDLDKGMRALRPGAVALGRSTPDLRGVLREGAPVMDRLRGVAGLATPAVRSLADVMPDARPLADRLVKTMNSSSGITSVLAPYTPELIRFFHDWNSANQYGDASGHTLRIDLVVRPESITGAIPVRDPLVHRDPYPAPGQAQYDRVGG